MSAGTIKDFRDGCRDAIPICLGYIAVSFAFGIESSKIGMTPFQAAMTSLLNVTSAGQFSALELIARNGSFVELEGIEDSITLNSVIQEAYQGETLLNEKMEGDFPVLKPGNNLISWSGDVTRLVIAPNWRYL